MVTGPVNASSSTLLTSRQFIDWLEEKLRKAGVKKVVPDAAVLGEAWRRALWLAQVREQIAEVSTEPCIALPKNLEADLRRRLKRFPEFSWDEALAQIAEKHLKEKPLLLESGGRANAK